MRCRFGAYVLTVAAAAGHVLVGSPATVATYSQSFASPPTAAGRWSYLWNAPQEPFSISALASESAGGITDPSTYRRLEKAGAGWAGLGGLRLSATGGLPGPGAVESGTAYGRYAIAGFQVTREGCYAIRQSRLSKPAAEGNPIDVIVHANRWRPVLRKFCRPGETIGFDTDIGYLPAGATLYVAVGPGANSQSDGFELDFAIAREETASLQDQVDRAKAEGRSAVRLAPGRYYLAQTLWLENWRNFDLDADGVTVIAPPQISAIVIRGCAGGRLHGLVIDQDPLPVTQGAVTAIAPDRKSAEMKIDAYYPVPAAGRPAGDRNMIFDPATLDQIHPAAGFNIANLEREGGDRCRLAFKEELAQEIRVGDVLSIQAGAGPSAFVVDDSTQMRIEGVTLHSSGGFSFLEHGGGDNIYRGLKLIPGPAHLLASRPRLRTSVADGFHSRDACIGPKVSDSVFERMGDDGMAIDGPWGVVAGVSSGRQVVIAVREAGMFRTGEPLRFFRFADRSQTRGAVVASAREDDEAIAEARRVVRGRFPTFHDSMDYKEAWRVTLGGEGPLAVKPGDLVAFPDLNGEGFEFRDNRIEGGRSRGIIVKANGLIAGNRIVDVQKPGILIYSAFGHDAMEAQFVEHLVVEHNVIEGCDFMRPVQNSLRYSGGIVITADTAVDRTQWGADGHHGIRIEDNVIRGLYRGVNLTVSDASDVILRGNRFIDTHEHPGGGGGDCGMDNRAVIWIDHADRVQIEDCRVEGLGPYGDPGRLVVTTATANHVTGTLQQAR